MAEKDYYKLLGVAKGATKEEIKKAYKKLALKFHPDRAEESKKKEYEEKFKEINEAASVLGDDTKRAQYDQFGAAGVGNGRHQGFDNSDFMSQFRSGNFGDFGDIFDSIFGGGGRGRGTRPQRGSDLLYETQITLEEAAKGIAQTITLNKLEHCGECSGKGATQFDQCTHCGGSGQFKQTQRTPFGVFQQTRPCHQCDGKGEVGRNPCDTCIGEGVVRKRKKIDVTIPAGIENGMRLRLSGEGEIGANRGPSGNLFVEVEVKTHKYFERIENDLHITIPISFTQATLGDEIEVPTID